MIACRLPSYMIAKRRQLAKCTKAQRAYHWPTKHPCPTITGQVTAPRPFFATRVSSFSEAPCGRFSPRSHWLTRPVVVTHVGPRMGPQTARPAAAAPRLISTAAAGPLPARRIPRSGGRAPSAQPFPAMGAESGPLRNARARPLPADQRPQHYPVLDRPVVVGRASAGAGHDRRTAPMKDGRKGI